MGSEIIGLFGMILLLVLVFCGMNIGLCMAAVGFLGFACIEGFASALSMLGTTAYSTLENYTLTVIPLFILMGSAVAYSGMGEVLYNACRQWLGGIRGGLAMATIVACAVFGAMCGSSLAEVATMARIAVPEMKRRGYDESFAAGCVACAGSLAILIPPSIGFVIYGIITEQPIGVLFIAGIIPGIILTFLFILTVFVMSVTNPSLAPQVETFSWKERIGCLKLVGPILLIVVLILGGIYGGVFTPTEAGAVGAMSTIIIALLYGYLNGRKLYAALLDSVLTIAMIILIVIGAFIFSKFLTVSGLGTAFPSYIATLALPRWLVLICVIAFYIILGMFFDVLSGMVLTLPLIYPVIQHYGFDPIWFGVVLVMLMEMGLATPPIGMNVFVLSAVTDVPVEKIFKGSICFIIAILVCIVIVIIFPQTVSFLVRKMASH